ncbi:MAG: excinuclease ABC subunit UvrC [Candidatus Omnitrophica bacterium]|nr:excinuclease ABC subunit UvrC [Candidatus Omnitrophota bacterium]
MAEKRKIIRAKENSAVKKTKSLPDLPGVYIMKDEEGKVLYVGKASSLKKRVGSYFHRGVFAPNKELLLKDIADFDIIVCESEAKALLLENSLIKEARPKYNIDLRDDKNFPFIEISRDDFPRLAITRKRKKDFLYFGPYPQAKPLNEALELIRKTFPFRTCKIMPKKECLYFHISLCPGPCIGRISKRDYAKVIRMIFLILEGKRKDLLDLLRRKMNRASERLKFEQASLLRDKLTAVSSLYGIKREYSQLVCLKSSLGLARMPRRIEAIDISNIQDRQATGSVVVFEEGVPLKSEYRRYKIKGKAKDDVTRLSEVVDRRIKSLLSQNKIFSDLVIIDGGLPQVNAAKDVMGRYKLDIAVIGISKKNEEVWFPYTPTSLKLPVSSLALRIIQRLRDEAHRFAHKYHLFLRRKATYGK